MQTFLAYPRFVDSARVLDDSRLGNQRNECYTILEVIVKATSMPDSPKEKRPETGFYMFGASKKNTKELPWYNHPAVKMWRDYRWALLSYSFSIVREWVARGYQDNTKEKFLKFGKEVTQTELESWETRLNERYKYNPKEFSRAELIPWWLGSTHLHASHRSNLLAKDVEHYSQFNWKEDAGHDYYWPA